MAKDNKFEEAMEDVIDEVDLMVDEYDNAILWKGLAILGGTALLGGIIGAAISGHVNYKEGFKDGAAFDPTRKKK